MVPNKFRLTPFFTPVFIGVFVLIAAYVNGQPKSAVSYLEKGELAMQQRQWTNARLFLDSCLQKDPSYADAYYSRGITKEQLKDYDGALTDYNIYVEFRPDHFEALLNRGQLNYRLKKYEQARQDFLKILTLQSGETSTVFFRQDAFSSSVNKIFTIQGSKNKGYIFNHLGLVETRLQNVKNAIIFYDSAIRLEPDEADYYVNRGLAKASAGDAVGSQSDYKRALHLDPTNEVALHNLAVNDSQRHMLEMEALDKLIESQPSLPYPYAERAFLHFNKKNYKSALIDYDKAIQIDSTDEEYYLHRGLTKEKLKDMNGALSDYSRAISIRTNFEKAWFSRGNLLSKQNRLEEAIEDYTVAIFYFPEYGAAFYNRGVSYHRLKKMDEACADVRKAENLGFEIDPGVVKKICIQK